MLQHKKPAFMKWIWFLLISSALVLADQGTKKWAALALKGKNGIPVVPGVFELFYLYPENKGIAFGMFEGNTALFSALALLLVILILRVYSRMPEDRRFLPMRIVCILILSGAVGNLADRVSRGYVIDFLYFSLIDFPVFNLADTYVVCGGILMVLLGIFKYTDDEDFAWLKKRS